MRSLMTRGIAVTAVLAFLHPLAAAADEVSTDAPGDSASNAPAAVVAAEPSSLSSICTDRPTRANGACTVDEGHIQYETDLFNGAFARVGGVTTDTYLASNPTLKYGLTKSIDLELNIAPYEVVHTSDQFGVRSTKGGVGDLYLRLKDNSYNSADGKLSVAVIPYIKVPTARIGIGNGAVEGGAIVPVDYKITDQITLAYIPEVDAFKDAANDGRHVNTSQLVNVGCSLPNNVTAYGELWADWNFDPMGTIHQVSADVAIAWGLTHYLQLDAGLNFGLNRSTPAIQPYFGVSQKF